MVTPFTKDDHVDYGALKAFVDWQCESGVEGLCPVGTTGESPTLSHEEHHEVIAKVIEYAAGRVKIIAGTGANSTAEAVSLTQDVIARGGADATLQVTPYYNKPNAEGLYRHFMTVPNVVAIKEAAGSVERVSAIRHLCPELTVLSGDDSLALPMIAVGASGVISVASDVMPREISDFIRTALAGDFAAARDLHNRYYDLFHDLFIDTNPIMVKEALVMTGRIGPGFRLPLCETTPEKREKLRATLAALGLQV